MRPTELVAELKEAKSEAQRQFLARKAVEASVPRELAQAGMSALSSLGAALSWASQLSMVDIATIVRVITWTGCN